MYNLYFYSIKKSPFRRILLNPQVTRLPAVRNSTTNYRHNNFKQKNFRMDTNGFTEDANLIKLFFML